MPKGEDPPCVWGSLNAIRSSKLYFALRNPNPLIAGPMISAGPLDVYGDFIDGLTEEQDTPGFRPFTRGADFFVFAYDWRQEIATVTAPLLVTELEKYAQIHEEKTGIPAAETKFVLVGHSMGGIVRPDVPQRKPPMGRPHRGDVPRRRAQPRLGQGHQDARRRAWRTQGKTRSAFPESLLNLLPNSVDANVTKLVAISRPSLYELLPFDDPRWESVLPNGARQRISAQDLLTVGPWEQYWPTAELERRLYLDDWLKKRIAEGRKEIVQADWQFCQDPDLKAPSENAGAGSRMAAPDGESQLIPTRCCLVRMSRRA